MAVGGRVPRPDSCHRAEAADNGERLRPIRDQHRRIAGAAGGDAKAAAQEPFYLYARPQAYSSVSPQTRLDHRKVDDPSYSSFVILWGLCGLRGSAVGDVSVPGGSTFVRASGVAPARLVALWWPWIDDALARQARWRSPLGVGLFGIAVVLGAAARLRVPTTVRSRSSQVSTVRQRVYRAGAR